MKGLFFVAFLVSFSISGSLENPTRITGDLLEHWQGAASTSVLSLDSAMSIHLNKGIDELCITGIEVTSDSLNIYLLGIPEEDGIPFLLATGGYRGEYNFAKSLARYEEGEICIYFQMPYSARYSMSSYSWDLATDVLVETDHLTGDPSLDALGRVEEYLEIGQIEEAIVELNDIMYPSNYFDETEMETRLLRAANRFALIASEDGNYTEAVDIFESLSAYIHVSPDRYLYIFDSLDYSGSNFSNYMEESEFVNIMSNRAIFLEKIGDLEKSSSILRHVLQLDCSHTISYLSIADISWIQGELSNAERFYSTYLGLMTSSGLISEIPSRVYERTHLSFVTSDSDVPLTLLSEELLSIESFPTTHMTTIYRDQQNSGVFRFSDCRHVILDPVPLGPSWSINFDSQGSSLSVSETIQENSPRFSIPDFGESEDLALIATDEYGDTLWVTSFEGEPLEWVHSPSLVQLQDGGYMVDNPPDCFAAENLVSKLSESGVEIFSTVLETTFILDSKDDRGEVIPFIGSFRETSRGDILVTGSAAILLTDPKSSFVCLLDGETGDIQWKVNDYGLGMVRINDVIETSSGSFVAVGSTGLRKKTPNRGPGSWVSSQPFALLIDQLGEIQESFVYSPEFADNFFIIVELNEGDNEFLIVANDYDSDQLVLVEAILE